MATKLLHTRPPVSPPADTDGGPLTDHFMVFDSDDGSLKLSVYKATSSANLFFNGMSVLRFCKED